MTIHLEEGICALEWEYSDDVNMGYMYLPGEKKYKHTEEFSSDKLNGALYIDLNKEGKIKGIEFDGFSKMLPEIAKKLLAEA